MNLDAPESAGRPFRPMFALIAKDWRLARAPVVALLVMSVGCYLVPLSAVAGWSRPRAEFFEQLETCAVCAIFFPAIVASALGGMAVAGERADLTADFIAVLPVTRVQVILSKWIVAALVVCGSALIHLAMFAWMLRVDPRYRVRPELADSVSWAAMWIAPVLALFGVAWGLGTFTRNVSIGACGSIAVAVCVPLWFLVFGSHGRFAGFDWTMPSALVDSAIGLAGLFGGTAYYLRRVAP